MSNCCTNEVDCADIITLNQVVINEEVSVFATPNES